MCHLFHSRFGFVHEYIQSVGRTVHTEFCSTFGSADGYDSRRAGLRLRKWEQALGKRPCIRREWCERVVANPLKKEVQPDGRIRHWGVVPELGGRALRVVTLEDGETILNAFPDRNFRVG